jgi:hypothetical protein
MLCDVVPIEVKRTNLATMEPWFDWLTKMKGVYNWQASVSYVVLLRLYQMKLLGGV